MSKSRMINTALCSYGMSGKVFHAPFLQIHEGFNLYAVWERSKKRIHEDYQGVLSYDSYQQLLNDPAIELIIVNTPNYTHYDYTKAALEADKHVIVEKPFTSTVAEAEELVKLAISKGKLLSVFQNRRWDSDFKTVRYIINEKVLGDIVEAEIHFDRFNVELSPKVHKETPGPGTGVLHDLGPHIIDQALQLFGQPVSLFADLRIIRPQSQVSDYLDILLYYPVNRVRLKSSYLVKEPLPAYIIHGSNGSFLKSRSDIQEISLQKGLKPDNNDWGIEAKGSEGILHITDYVKDSRTNITALPGNYIDYYNGIYTAIINNTPPPVTADEGLAVMQIIEAAIKSNEQKKVIHFD